MVAWPACFARSIPWLGALIGIAIVVIGTQYLASESGEVVVLRTLDAAGGVHETRLWVVDHDGSAWLRAGNPTGGWFPRLSARPEVEVVRGSETRKFLAAADARSARHDQRPDAARNTASPTATSASSFRARRRSRCAWSPSPAGTPCRLVGGRRAPRAARLRWIVSFARARSSSRVVGEEARRHRWPSKLASRRPRPARSRSSSGRARARGS